MFALKGPVTLIIYIGLVLQEKQYPSLNEQMGPVGSQRKETGRGENHEKQEPSIRNVERKI